ncbi:unnamed protein product [Spodoptera exigua]|nr:unnamed protein product [Spodoptera exigua]
MRGHIDPPPFQGLHFESGMPPPFGFCRGPDFHGAHRRPGFGPFGHEECTEHQHPRQRHGPREGGRCGGCSCDSDEEERCCGPRNFRRRPGGRPDFMFGPFGPGRHCHRFGPWGGPWNGPWRGLWCPGHRHPWAGRFAPYPWCNHMNESIYDRSEHQRCKKNDTEKCCENKPCCSGNKDKRRGKDNAPCSDTDKDQNTVFVQRIVLEKSARPQSV